MKLRLLFFGCFFCMFFNLKAQTAAIKKLVTDDKGHVNKADTSVVVIQDTVYRKIISVQYESINIEQITNEFENKMKFYESEKIRQKEALDKTQMEILQIRNFYNKAKKELKIATATKIEDKVIEKKQQNDIDKKKNEERTNFIDIPDSRNIIRN